MTDQKTPLSVEIRHATSALDLNVDRATLYRWADDSAALEAKLEKKPDLPRFYEITEYLKQNNDDLYADDYGEELEQIVESALRTLERELADACEASGIAGVDEPMTLTEIVIALREDKEAAERKLAEAEKAVEPEFSKPDTVSRIKWDASWWVPQERAEAAEHDARIANNAIAILNDTYTEELEQAEKRARDVRREVSKQGGFEHVPATDGDMIAAVQARDHAYKDLQAEIARLREENERLKAVRASIEGRIKTIDENMENIEIPAEEALEWVLSILPATPPADTEE